VFGGGGFVGVLVFFPKKPVAVFSEDQVQGGLLPFAVNFSFLEVLVEFILADVFSW